MAGGLPFYENFYADGTRSVRGFTDNTLGPRSEAIYNYSDGQSMGGSLKTTGSLELYYGEEIERLQFTFGSGFRGPRLGGGETSNTFVRRSHWTGH